MALHGELLIGGASRLGANGAIRGVEAATGEPLEPGLGGAPPPDREEAVRHAAEAVGH